MLVKSKDISNNPQGWVLWLPLFALPALALSFQTQMPAWVFMWTVSFAIFCAFKWVSFWHAIQHLPDSDKSRLSLFWLWPGMDADAFVDTKGMTFRPRAFDWAFAATKFLIGGFLFWGFARTVPSEWLLLRGWVGLIGLAFLLHFGSFQLLAFFWQGMGIEVTPLMKAPLASRSLTEFWSHRWNLAFRQLANRIAFQPLHKRLGPMGAMGIVFLGSGLIHELAISLPAQGGYGLPTLYFMLQACGMTFERSFIGKKMGLGSGYVGWMFTMFVTVGPAFWLFHPPFVRNVVIPFMEAMYAL